MSPDHPAEPPGPAAPRSAPSPGHSWRRLRASMSTLDRAPLVTAAVATAVTAGAAASLVCVAGFRLHPLSLVVLCAVWIGVLAGLNKRAIISMEDQAGRLHVPGRRLLYAGALALVVAAPFTLCALGPQVDALAGESRGQGPTAVDAAAEEARLQAVIETPVPQVEDDREVARFREQVTVVQNALREADRLVVCEKDGTCGSEIRGEGTNFETKTQARDRISAQLHDVEAELGTARAAADARNANLVRAQGDARSRLTGLRVTRAAAVEAVDTGASLDERFRSVWAVGYRWPVTTALVPFLGIALYLLLDLGPLTLHARRRLRTPQIPTLVWDEDPDDRPGDGPPDPDPGDWPPRSYPSGPAGAMA